MSRSRNQVRKLTSRVYKSLADMDVMIRREDWSLRRMYGSDLHCSLYVAGPDVAHVVRRLKGHGVPVCVTVHEQEPTEWAPRGLRGTYVEICPRFGHVVDREIWCGGDSDERA